MKQRMKNDGTAVFEVAIGAHGGKQGKIEKKLGKHVDTCRRDERLPNCVTKNSF